MSENDFKKVESNSGFGYVYAPEPREEFYPPTDAEPSSWVSERLVRAATAMTQDKVRIRELELELKVMAEDRDEYRQAFKDECSHRSVFEKLSTATCDELRIVDAFCAKLMGEGRREHGELDLASDGRSVTDLLREGLDEQLDACFYLLAAQVKAGAL